MEDAGCPAETGFASTDTVDSPGLEAGLGSTALMTGREPPMIVPASATPATTRPAPMITARVGLDEVADAFAALGDPERHAKILVHPREAR